MLLLLDFRQSLLGQGEDERDGVKLRDDHDPRGVARVHDVALVHEADAGAAIQRRGDGGVGELHAGVIDGGRVVFHLGRELRGLRLLVIELLRGDHLLLRQILVALQVALGVFILHLILALLRERLVERGLEGRGIDLHEQIALLHLLAFLEADLFHLAIDAGADGHGIERLHRAEAIEVNGHILLRDLARDHRHGKAAARDRRPPPAYPPPPGASARCAITPPVTSTSKSPMMTSRRSGCRCGDRARRGRSSAEGASP